MPSAQVDGDLWDTARFIDSVRLPYIAPSLGGVESLIEQPTVVSYWDQARPAAAPRLRSDRRGRARGRVSRILPPPPASECGCPSCCAKSRKPLSDRCLMLGRCGLSPGYRRKR
jgi:hypothetical protein